MKTPEEILAKTENGLPRPSWTSRTPIGDDYAADESRITDIPLETKAHVNMIFARFMAIYGHKFKSCFETQNEIRLAKREWALSLRGYAEADLVAAVNRCKETLAWMPTVSEFLTILRSINGDFGLPAPYAAYQEACQYAADPLAHSWSHVAVYLAGKETGWFRLRAEEQGQVLPEFGYAYDLFCQRVRRGETLEQPIPKAISDQQDNTTARFIQAFATEHQLPESLLYYMTKPLGTRIRERLRADAQLQVEAMGLNLQLPADTSMGVTSGGKA
ncbi:replication protein P [Nitrincola iocasae]|nr:replication protein P [Nitrincola iocasae]